MLLPQFTNEHSRTAAKVTQAAVGRCSLCSAGLTSVTMALAEISSSQQLESSSLPGSDSDRSLLVCCTVRGSILCIFPDLRSAVCPACYGGGSTLSQRWDTSGRHTVGFRLLSEIGLRRARALAAREPRRGAASESRGIARGGSGMPVLWSSRSTSCGGLALSRVTPCQWPIYRCPPPPPTPRLTLPWPLQPAASVR
jgi:hypothetical protein